MPDIELPPGVVKTQSGPAAIGRYTDLDKVRFVALKPEKIRGWRKLFEDQLVGTPRGIHAYLGPAGLQIVAIGTDLKLYIIDTTEVLTDITPLRIQTPVTLAAEPFAMTNLSADVVVTAAGHGYSTGHYVSFSGAVAGHGITIAGKYQVTVLSDDTYRITHSGAATSTGSGGGPDVVATAMLGDNPFTTTLGLATFSVAHTAHGVTEGSYVTFSGAASVGSIHANGEYAVTSVTDDDNYVLTHGNVATASASGGGLAVAVSYQINIGSADGAISDGYGVGAYGTGTYGTPRAVGDYTLDPTYWSLDNYGDNLLAARQTGNVYLYDHETDDRAEPIANSPTDVRYSFVTEERFIFALCDDMNIKWPDQDNPTDWTPSITDTANTRRLSGGSKLMAGVDVGGGVSLVWTDAALYLFQYTGDAFVYASRMVGGNCGIIGPGAFCTVDGLAFWMSKNGFHMYAGGVLPIPNDGDVSGWVFDNLNESQASKTICFYNARDREVWWLYADTTSTEPNRYVAVNIDQWYWIVGSLDRSGATHHAAGRTNPILASPDGYVYEHELTDDFNDDGAAMAWFLETGLWRIEGAAQSVDIFGFSPDFETVEGDITFTAYGQDRPQSTSIDSEEETINSSTEMADLRVAGRYFKFRMEQSEIDGNFRLGVPVLEIQSAGYRR
jgi:hypothetical protein